MRLPTPCDPQRLLFDEQSRVLEEYERLVAERYGLPHRDRSLRRGAGVLLQWVGGFVLALNVAIVAILACFIVMNMLIHVSL